MRNRYSSNKLVKIYLWIFRGCVSWFQNMKTGKEEILNTSRVNVQTVDWKWNEDQWFWPYDLEGGAFFRPSWFLKGRPHMCIDEEDISIYVVHEFYMQMQDMPQCVDIILYPSRVLYLRRLLTTLLTYSWNFEYQSPWFWWFRLRIHWMLGHLALDISTHIDRQIESLWTLVKDSKSSIGHR